jgi:hypothetical protein
MLHLKNYLSTIEQAQLVQLARKVVEISLTMTPAMPSGHKFNCQDD